MEPAVNDLSMSVPRRQAASIPVPSPTNRKTTVAPSASETVSGSRSIRVDQTCSLVWYE